jgi:prevent-host-death family protein
LEVGPVDIVNVHEAKTHLSRVLERVAAGEEVIIAKAGKPVAKLVPLRGGKRLPGRLAGRIRMGNDFDAPLPASLRAAFGGGDDGRADGAAATAARVADTEGSGGSDL